MAEEVGRGGVGSVSACFLFLKEKGEYVHGVCCTCVDYFLKEGDG